MTIRKMKQQLVDIRVKTLFDFICAEWKTDITKIQHDSRKQRVSAQRKLLWLAGKEIYPEVRYKALAELTGRKDHHGIMKGIRSAKDLISVSDPCIMRYYRKIKPLINVKHTA